MPRDVGPSSPATRRELNERIAGWAKRRKVPRAETVAFYCECDDAACFERIALAAADYKALRAIAHAVAVVPGHRPADGEPVGADRGHYLIVRRGPWVTDG